MSQEEEFYDEEAQIATESAQETETEEGTFEIPDLKYGLLVGEDQEGRMVYEIIHTNEKVSFINLFGLLELARRKLEHDMTAQQPEQKMDRATMLQGAMIKELQTLKTIVQELQGRLFGTGEEK